MSPILVTLTSRSDSNLERSNISLKENRPDCVALNSDGLDFCVRKKENFYGLRHTVLPSKYIKRALVFSKSQHGLGSFTLNFICNFEISNQNSNFQREVQSNF